MIKIVEIKSKSLIYVLKITNVLN